MNGHNFKSREGVMPTRRYIVEAIRSAVALSAIGIAVTCIPALALAQSAASGTSGQQVNKAKTLQTVVVTGTAIRRVTLQTANPITVVSSAEIKGTGSITVGNLLQQLPAAAGVQTNTQTNFQAGSGVTSVSLRGLGASRTLVLIDGHRVQNPDLNLIPVALIEQVQVLKAGAGTLYGSDAIGGVVNIILKHQLNAHAEFSTSYGSSSGGGGQRHDTTLMLGSSTDHGSMIFGVNYNKQSNIMAADRSFAAHATTLTNGKVVNQGSTATPTGFLLPPANIAAQFGCPSLTLASGTGAALGDWKCYNPVSDSFNSQLGTQILVPTERTNAFFVGHEQLTDDIDLFAQIFYDNTKSDAQVAAPPFGASVFNVPISQYSMYNPFGVTFGPTGQGFQSRFTGVGSRTDNQTTTTMQGVVGLKGSVGAWDWDAYGDYGHERYHSVFVNYPSFPGSFKQTLGPSMLIGGVPSCVGTPGDASSVIAGCIPINIFNQASPEVSDQLRSFFTSTTGQTNTLTQSFYADANGPVMSLPGGEMQLAVGVDYRKQHASSEVGSLRLITDPTLGSCETSQSLCALPLEGSFNVKEVYGELFVPIAKDLPFIQSLNVTIGDRYSKYSDVGSTSNWKVAVEWRPISDLLVRANVDRVFRAPTITDLFAGASGASPNLLDPCGGLSAAQLAAHSRACEGVPVNWSGPQFVQTFAHVSGSAAAGTTLKPEEGKTFDYGVVYDPHYIAGLSLNVDFWRVFLHGTIVNPGAQTVMNVCFQDNNSPLCDLISRPNSNTHLTQFQLPTVNLGNLYFQGVDFGLVYNLPGLDWAPGRWKLGFESTYLNRADFDTAPGVIPTTHLAGKYNIDFGNYARFRAVGTLSWGLGPWDAMWRVRYVSPVQVGSADPAQNMTADLRLPSFVLPVASVTYSDFSVGYRVEAIHTSFSAGVNNAFNRRPPFLPGNVTNNANTDVSTYDVIGRFYWANASVRF